MKIIYHYPTHTQTNIYDDSYKLIAKEFTFKPSPHNNYKTQTKRITKNFPPLDIAVIEDML